MNKNLWDKQWQEMREKAFQMTSLNLFALKAYLCFRKWISISDKRILEAGCGTGRFCIKIAEDNPSSTVVGLDLSVNAIKLSSEGARIRGLKNVRFIQGDIFNMPFSDNTFDIVFSEGVIEHFYNFEEAIKEKIRVAKVDGKIITAVPNWYCFPHTIYKKLAGNNYEYGYERSFKHKELVELYNKHGLKDIELSGFHPAHSINRLSKFLAPLGYFIDKIFVVPGDKLTKNSISKYFGMEIVIRGIKK
jgi:SAM-dependent methyltransferase